MFLRRKHIVAGGKAYDYYAVVENVREGGKVRQKTVVHLGKLDLKDSRRVLEWLKALALLSPGVVVAEASDVVPQGSVVFAPLLAAKAAWDFWGLGEAIKRVTGEDVSRLAFVMTSNRLTDPGSKLYVSQWFPRTALPQLLGLRSEDVYDERLYMAMDELLPARCAVEGAVSSKLREVGQDLRVLLYDITSTYFLGRESELLKRGYSRDHRADKPQVTVGLVTTVDGFPLTHRVYPGNR
ncbi:MAG: IS1634 family transposase [Bacillota bacterium]